MTQDGKLNFKRRYDMEKIGKIKELADEIKKLQNLLVRNRELVLYVSFYVSLDDFEFGLNPTELKELLKLTGVTVDNVEIIDNEFVKIDVPLY